MPTFFLLLAMIMTGFAVAMLVRRVGAGGTARVTEPSCGKCGYCVRGLESMTCPECGSDLREVGILTPGRRKPMTTGMRLLMWALLAPLPAIFISNIAAQWLTPWQVVTTSRRVIFSQSQYLNATITAELDGQKAMIGRRSYPYPPVAMQDLKLTLGRGTPSDKLTVDLRDNTARFTDAAGKVASVPFDAGAIDAWLAANGFTDPRVAKRSQDVMTAITEMTSGKGQVFSRYDTDPKRGGIATITAHPASPPFTVFQPTRFTNLVPWALAAVLWLAGMPFVLLLGRRVQSRRDADQA